MFGRLEFQKYQEKPYVISSIAANSCQRPSFLITVVDTNFTTDRN